MAGARPEPDGEHAEPAGALEELLAAWSKRELARLVLILGAALNSNAARLAAARVELRRRRRADPRHQAPPECRLPSERERPAPPVPAREDGKRPQRAEQSSGNTARAQHEPDERSAITVVPARGKQQCDTLVVTSPGEQRAPDSKTGADGNAQSERGSQVPAPATPDGVSSLNSAGPESSGPAALSGAADALEIVSQAIARLNAPGGAAGRQLPGPAPAPEVVYLDHAWRPSGPRRDPQGRQVKGFLQ